MAKWHSHIRQFSMVSFCVCGMNTIVYAQDALPPVQPLPMPDEMSTSSPPASSTAMDKLTKNVGQVFEPMSQQDTEGAIIATADPSSVVGQPAAQISLGGFGISMMYNEEDIGNVSRVLTVYEATVATDVTTVVGADTGEQDILSELLRSMQGEGEVMDEAVELAPLPQYYVGTIMYRRAGDWAVWVNGERFDDERKVKAEDALQVVGIGRERVTLAWRPENVSQAHERWKSRANPNLGKVNHRHAHRSYVQFDEEKRRFTISMRSNQTFSGEQMDIIEGRLVEGVLLQQVSVGQGAQAVVLPDGGDAASVQKVRVPTEPIKAMDREVANKLIDNVEQLQKFIPKPQNPKP